MGKAWKIIADVQRGDGPPLKEYYLVAIPDRYAAIEALRIRKDLQDAELTVSGEAPPDFVDWLDVKPWQILCIMVVQ
jgi:hypothetical protein